MGSPEVPECGETVGDRGPNERPGEPGQTDVVTYALVSADRLISAIRDLGAIVRYGESHLSNERLRDLGFVLEGGDPLEDQANWLLDDMSLCVEMETTFEVVLGTGEPDRRLCFECSGGSHGPKAYAGDLSFAIRRVFYRYSWSGSAEVELTGEAREIAEAFGRRVVPELGG